MIAFIIKSLGRLSLKTTQSLGIFLGILAYIGSKRYRELLNTHLGDAAKQYGFRARPWSAAKSAGLMLSDSLWIWNNHQLALAKTQVHDWHLIESALEEGKGLLLLAPHLGAFEIIPRILALHFPATILYKPAKQKWLNDIIEAGRAHPNMNFVPANMQGVRQIARALQKNEVVAMLPDQVPGVGDGVWAKFFGRFAYTVVLPAKIARRNNVPTFLMASRRLPAGRGWEIHIERMNEPFSEDPIEAATQLNSALEKIIVSNPDQYLWGYNRYKHPAGAELPPKDTA